jgi:serine/threonine protein kinase
MGEVDRARATKLTRGVALKVLSALVSGGGDRLARFRRGAQVLAALNHPNVAHIHDLEDAGPTPAFVMEIVEGQTLDVLIRAHGDPRPGPGAGAETLAWGTTLVTVHGLVPGAGPAARRRSGRRETPKSTERERIRRPRPPRSQEIA